MGDEYDNVASGQMMPAISDAHDSILNADARSKGKVSKLQAANQNTPQGSALTSLLNQPPNKKMTPGLKKLVEM